MSAAAAPVRARLFGLDVESRLVLAGVPDEGAAAAGEPLVLERASRRELLAGSAAGDRHLSDHRDGRGRPVLRVAQRPDDQVLMTARGWGAFLLGPRTIRCAPLRIASWRWQRYLIGQVLPFAAVMRGLEVLHASAVAVGGEAIAITGPSQAGKSTLAAEWLGRGAPLVADDVVALDVDGRKPRVHPGPGILSLRADAPALRGDLQALGPVLGIDEHGARLVVTREREALPLGALVFLERTAGGAPRVRRVAEPHPQLLLSATFNLAVRTPDRLVRLLDVCEAIASSVAVLQVGVPPGAAPADVADAIERELGAR
jgi:hypothetical protein